MRSHLLLVLGGFMLLGPRAGSTTSNSMSKATLFHTTASIALSTTAEASRDFCTAVWSTTETTISRPQFYGPTLVTILASRTITTLEQKDQPTSYPCTLTDTFISRVTYEYRMTFSDGHSSTSISSAEYTIPTTRTQLVASTATSICGVGKS
ncbi:hypothetical protein GE09DRAFT_305504 [Coniochaeta sp. 2T2.1]|nr:hypothetical protein GE09DRAFT_305504 [Coniochaeta sp. 2T2.1]